MLQSAVRLDQLGLRQPTCKHPWMRIPSVRASWRTNEWAKIDMSMATLPSYLEAADPSLNTSWRERLGADSMALSSHELEMAVQRRHRRER